MKIKVMIEYDVEPKNYMFLGVGNCPNGIYNAVILEQEEYALVNLILEKINPGQNLKIKTTEIQ